MREPVHSELFYQIETPQGVEQRIQHFYDEPLSLTDAEEIVEEELEAYEEKMREYYKKILERKLENMIQNWREDALATISIDEVIDEDDFM